MRKGAFEHALSGVRVQAPFGARVQKVQRVQRVEVGASKLLKAPSLYKTFTTALRARKCILPLWCLTAPPFPRSSVGRQKESALMGRLGALLRPTWRSYAGPPQGTIKPRYAVSCL